MRWSTILAVGAMLVGCSPALTTMAPARTAPAGHVRAAASVDVATAPRDVRELAAEMQALSAQTPEEAQGNREEIERVIDETAAAIVSPPSIGMRASAAYGITDWLEVGAATTANTVRGNLRLRLFELEGPGLYGVASLGGGTWLMGYPVGLVTDRVQLDEHSRYDLEAAVHVGLSGRLGHVWLGPKVVRSTYGIGYTGCVRASQGGECQDEAHVSLDGTATYFAGQLGIALGGPTTWFSIEMTAAHLMISGNVHAEAMGYSGDRTIDHQGWVFSPSVGVMMTF